MDGCCFICQTQAKTQEMEQKYVAWAEQLCTAGTRTVLVWAPLVPGYHGARASLWAQLGVKPFTHTYQLWRPQSQAPTVSLQAGCRACSGTVYWGVRFLPSHFSSLFLCSPVAAAQALHLVLRARFLAVPLNWCLGDLDSVLSGFCKLAPWCWATPPP